MDFYNTVFFTVLISGFLFIVPVFFIVLVKFNIVKTRMVKPGKRKWVYAGLIIAAMLISPGATPIGDLILFVALAVLFEGSIFVGRFFEHQNGADLSKSKLETWFSTSTCKYCHTSVDKTKTDFCPNCNRSIR